MSTRYAQIGPTPSPLAGGATSLATTANPVVVSGASPPLINQVLTATGLTDAVWSHLLRTTTANITASTTQTQGEGALVSDLNQVSTVANPNDTVTLPAASRGREIIVINSALNTLQVFPASGDDLGAGIDAATVQLTGVTNRYVAYDSTTWVKL